MISTKYWKNSLYCVIANGDSMTPLIENNAEVFIDPTKKYTNGVPVYYKLDNEWITADGRVLKVKDMTTEHLINCINLIQKRGVIITKDYRDGTADC